MGTTDISATKSAGNVVDETWYNNLRAAIIGTFVPRNPSTGALGGSPDLGSALYPWGNLYAGGLVIDGTAIDFGNLTGAANAIISGKVRSTSAFPDFIRANGSAASFQVLGATTNLVLNINSVATTVSTDITKSGLTVAPSSNNTCLVDDASLAGAAATKYTGEDNTVLTIDTAGSEITNRIGQYAIFKTGAEYLMAYISSATQLTNVYRGFLFDSSGAPLPRVAISNNDTLTIMSTGWVFVENDGATVDVTYTSPKYAYTAPGSPVTGDYWYDRANEAWKRYNGSAFVTINRTLIGVVAVNGTVCIASRSFNFNNSFSAQNSLSMQYVSATVVQSVAWDFKLNVYGTTIVNQFTRYRWDITSDLESGQTEASSTIYYAYVTEEGKPVLSNIKPYDQRGELAGWYHPYNAWRAIGYITNDGSSNFTQSTIINYSDTLQTNLDALSKLPGAADLLPYFTGERTMATTTLTSFARTLLDDADQAAAKVTLGIGTASTSTAGQVQLATDAETKTGTDTAKVAPVSSLKYHEGMKKAWVYGNGGGISDSYGVTSITNLATGSNRINFSITFANGNYSAVGTSQDVRTIVTLGGVTRSTTQCNIVTGNDAGTNVDVTFSAEFIGDI